MKYTIRHYHNKSRQGSYLAVKDGKKWHVYKQNPTTTSIIQTHKTIKQIIKYAKHAQKLHSIIDHDIPLIRREYRLDNFKNMRNEDIILKDIFQDAVKKKEYSHVGGKKFLIQQEGKNAPINLLLANKKKLYKNMIYDVQIMGKQGQLLLRHMFEAISPHQLYTYLMHLKTKAENGKLESSDIQRANHKTTSPIATQKIMNSCIFTSNYDHKILNNNIGSVLMRIKYINRV